MTSGGLSDLSWTPEEAALIYAPFADSDLLLFLAVYLKLPERGDGRYPASDLIGLHVALAPWLHRRRIRSSDLHGENP